MSSAYIFDCDGVLLDSNVPKIEALKNVLISIGAPMKFVDWALHEFKTNFGRTRKQHFDVFMQYEAGDFFKLSPEISLTAIEKYGRRVELLYKNCNVIPEAISFIVDLNDDDEIFVVSASDQSELRNILPSKIPALKKENIFGGPVSKLDNLNNVLKIVSSHSVFFFGDSVQDAQASMSAGVDFLGLSKYAADPMALELFCVKNSLNCIGSLSELIKS